MFLGIDVTIFDQSDFKEDSVREIIISPILSKLGFLPTGSNRVIRSKTLKHPFIRVGTRNHPVTTIPDYTLLIDDKPVFVLDAKAPNEDILKSDHLQQAYSYAIHPEIRCDEFGLCNGREIAIFSIHETEPLLHLSFPAFEAKWPDIEKYLLPKYLLEPILRRYAPDLGMAFSRMGTKQDTKIIIPSLRLNLFSKISDDLMTASANTDFGFGPHCASFDFHPNLLPIITSGLPSELANKFVEALNRNPFQAAAGLVIEIDATLKLGAITQGQSETFIPLIIEEVMDSRFNPDPIDEEMKDIPPYVFNLRESFVIKETKIDT